MADWWPTGTLAGRVLDTPVGPLTIAASAGGIVGIRFGAAGTPAGTGGRPSASARTAVGLVEQAARQIEAYFEQGRTTFDVPLDRTGTPFQLRVWDAIAAIPFGATATYGDLARRLGDVRLARAVGAASGANPVPIIVPCHRLVGSDGSLTGFGGGLPVKAALLRHEAQWVQPDLFGGG
jgi:methylated-DNA-[protein]-cysteine S-methyltransferase